MIRPFQKHTMVGQGANEFPQLVGQRLVVEFLGRRQVHSGASQRVERADADLQFHCEDLFQEPFLDGGIEIGGRAERDFAAGDFPELLLELIDADFTIHRMKIERIVLG